MLRGAGCRYKSDIQPGGRLRLLQRGFKFNLIMSSFTSIFQGKRVFFVTNNSSKSRKDYANKLENFGIKVSKVSSTSVGVFSLEIFPFKVKIFFW